jgi:hypothetical protein
VIGRIIGLEESRRLIYVRDTQGNIDEMKPEPGSESLRLKLSLDLPSGRTLEFTVPAPADVRSYLEEARVARSVGELATQLDNDLNGVEDEHDKAVKHAEGGHTYFQWKAQNLNPELTEKLVQILKAVDEESA